MSLTQADVSERWLLIQNAKNRPCQDCERQLARPAMTFDHLPGKGRGFWLQLGCVYRKTVEEIRAEIAKCEVVCIWCHEEREKRRGRLGPIGMALKKGQTFRWRLGLPADPSHFPTPKLYYDPATKPGGLWPARGGPRRP